MMSQSRPTPRSSFNMLNEKSSETGDPVVTLFHQWNDARATWERLAAAPGNEDFDAPESKAAEAEETAAFDAMIKTPPTSPAGVAVLASALWEMEGPTGAPGSEEYQKQANSLSCQLILAIWRAASGQDGLPPTG